MKFSLLYKTPEQQNYETQGDMREAIYNLSVDRLVGAVCADNLRGDAFLKVLSRPLHLEENIAYRQELVDNFLKQPQLLFELKRLFRRYDTIKSDWGEMRSNVHPYGASVSYKALMEYTFDLLKVSAKFAKMIAGYFKSAFEILDKYELTAAGLVGIKDYCIEMINNDSLNEVVEIANLFTLYSPPQYEFKVMAGLDDTLRVVTADLIGIEELEKLARDRKIWNVVKNLKSRAERAPEFKLGDGLIDDANFMLNEALFRMYTVMTEVAEHVYDMFFGLSDELSFYEGAMDYIGYLRRNHVTYCIPRIRPHEAEVFNADGLYDALLLVEGKNRDTIITNSVRLGGAEDGIMIRGNNSTGKTVYLRSIGTAQIMSQAGLPVCARRASISMRNAIFTQFSSAEKDFVMGDTAGRFEGEVQEVAHIIDNIKPHSLILFNETFQTTAYIEGARGIFDILSVFPQIGVKFIFVTRMTKLFEMCAGTGIKLMESGEGGEHYKIRPVEFHNVPMKNE
jgi:hypothetical protein